MRWYLCEANKTYKDLDSKLFVRLKEIFSILSEKHNKYYIRVCEKSIVVNMLIRKLHYLFMHPVLCIQEMNGVFSFGVLTIKFMESAKQWLPKVVVSRSLKIMFTAGLWSSSFTGYFSLSIIFLLYLLGPLHSERLRLRFLLLPLKSGVPIW